MNKEMLYQARLPKILEDEKTLTLEQVKADAWNCVAPWVPKVVGSLMLLPEDVDWHWTPYIQGGWRTWQSPAIPYVYADMNVYVKKIKNWGVLLPVFQALDTVGIPAESWKSFDDPASYTRIYRHEISVPSINVYIKIHATLPGDTEDCRRIIVGYTASHATVPILYAPTPIYKFDCKSDIQEQRHPNAQSDDDIPF